MWRRARLDERPQERLERDLLRAETDNHQQAGRVWRLQQALEQCRAVGVRPMQVVDDQQQRMALADSREDRPQRREGQSTLRGRLQRLRSRLRAAANRGYLQQNREGARERAHVVGHQRFDGFRGQSSEVHAQAVHEAIDSFVRNRLVFVTAAAQDDRARDSGGLVGELPHQSALADAGGPMNTDETSASFLCRRERLAERRQISFTTDKRQPLLRRHGLWRDRRRVLA